MENKSNEGVSIEHRRFIDEASRLVEIIRAEFPDVFSTLHQKFSNPNVLMKSGQALVFGVPLITHSQLIGDIDNVLYCVKVSALEFLRESRQQSQDDPEKMVLVSTRTIKIEILPNEGAQAIVHSTFSLSISIDKYGDENKESPLSMTATVPKAQNKQTVEDKSLGLGVSFEVNDPTIVPKHVLSLQKIASSKDPELGDHALRTLRELIACAISSVQAVQK